MQRSDVFPGWCAICRRATVGALAVGSLVALGPATAAQQAPPTVVRLAAQPEGAGLSWPGWTVRDPAEQKRSLQVLQAREKARRLPPASVGPPLAITPTATPAAALPGPPAGPPATLGGQLPLVAPQAVTVAIKYALSQVGKPYVWGATGPDTYDCSGLVQRSYATAGVALPRTSREQARVGTPVQLADLLPGDLLFWAYDPSDLSTVHHVAMYLGDGKIVQAPQPGEFVEVTTLWLSGYAGAVRVATGPADTALPTVPAGVPGTGLTPVGDAMPDGSPPPDVSPVPPTTVPPSAATATRGTGTTAPGTTRPGTTTPGTTTPGTTTPGTTTPGTTTPGTTTPGSTPSGSSASGTASPGTIAPGTNPPGTISPEPTAPATTPPPAPAPTSSAPSSPAATTSSAARTVAPATPPPTTPPPAPASTAPTSTAPASTAPASTAPASPTP